MTKKGKIILGIVLSFIVIAIGGTSAYYFNQNTKSKGPDVTQTTKAKHAKSKGKANKDAQPFTKDGVVKAAENFLQEVNKAPDGKMSDEDRLNLLKKDDANYEKVLTKKALSRVRLVDFMKTDNRGGALTAQALLNVTHSIKETGNKDIKAAEIKSYDTIVYMDKKAKIAIVPVDIFTTSTTNLGLEFMYIDGEWMFLPYSLISEITIRVTDQQTLAGTPEKETEEQGKETEKKNKEKNKETTKETTPEQKDEVEK